MPAPVLDAAALALLHWAAEYYHHPVGEVLAGALPKALRAGSRRARRARSAGSVDRPQGAAGASRPGQPRRAPRSSARCSASSPTRRRRCRPALRASCPAGASAARALLERGWLASAQRRRGRARRNRRACAPRARRCPRSRRSRSRRVGAALGGLSQPSCCTASPAAARPRCTCGSSSRCWHAGAAGAGAGAGDRPHAAAGRRASASASIPRWRCCIRGSPTPSASLAWRGGLQRRRRASCSARARRCSRRCRSSG